MSFTSTVFLFLFLPALLILYYLPLPFAKRRGWRNGILLLFSLGFYAWGEPVYVLLMLAAIAANWLLGLLIERTRGAKPSGAKLWLILAVALDVLMLSVFKFAGQLPGTAALVGVFPLGISFFTFQLISYVADIYRGRAPARKDPLSAALYVSLFPRVTSGPIVPYGESAKELGERPVTFRDVAEGLERFAFGMGKKLLLADYLSLTVAAAFDTELRSVGTAWLGAVCYTLQLYFDFSGYSDMAIGLGRMFGFHFSENFRHPLASASIAEFWRRWHISLGAWFREYVYIPLGGNRVSRGRWIFNLFVVWLLTGVWHGGEWTFVLWGLGYFVLLVLEKLFKLPERLGKVSHVYTVLAVILLFIFFRAADLAHAGAYFASLVGAGSLGLADGPFVTQLLTAAPVLAVSMALCLPLWPRLCDALRQRRGPAAEELLRAVVCLAVFCLALLQAVGSTGTTFLYFNF